MIEMGVHLHGYYRFWIDRPASHLIQEGETGIEFDFNAIHSLPE